MFEVNIVALLFDASEFSMNADKLGIDSSSPMKIKVEIPPPPVLISP